LFILTHHPRVPIDMEAARRSTSSPKEFRSRPKKQDQPLRGRTFAWVAASHERSPRTRCSENTTVSTVGMKQERKRPVSSVIWHVTMSAVGAGTTSPFRKFNGYDGIYGGQWKGPVFVLTHRPPDAGHHPAVTLLSDDLSDAVATAKDAAARKAVIVFGDNLTAQCLRAGLLDEIVIHLVRILLGDGIRLIGIPDLGPVALERRPVATSGQITDLRFAVRYTG
jgi:hypothetical protein